MYNKERMNSNDRVDFLPAFYNQHKRLFVYASIVTPIFGKDSVFCDQTASRPVQLPLLARRQLWY